MVPGAAMPFALPDELSRRDVIAYLKSISAQKARSAQNQNPLHQKPQPAG
jgi:hypothetical protein